MRTYDRMRLPRTPPRLLAKCASEDVRMARGSPTARLSATGNIDGLPFASPLPRRRRGAALELTNMRCAAKPGRAVAGKVCGHHAMTARAANIIGTANRCATADCRFFSKPFVWARSRTTPCMS
jgi:hypothetical protein